MKEMINRATHIVERDLIVGNGTSRDEENIVPWADLWMLVSHGFLEPPFDPIAPRGVPDSSSHRKAVAVVVPPIREHDDDGQSGRPRATVATHTLEIEGLAEPERSRDHQSSSYRWVGFFSSATVSFQRPLRRRAASTARPARVCMRFMKPCSRLRGIRFG